MPNPGSAIRRKKLCGCIVKKRFFKERVLKLIMKFSMREVLLYHGEDAFWVVECPSLPGCISQGETRETAIANIKEAIEGYIAVLQ